METRITLPKAHSDKVAVRATVKNDKVWLFQSRGEGRKDELLGYVQISQEAPKERLASRWWVLDLKW